MHSSTSLKDECTFSAAGLGTGPDFSRTKLLPHFISDWLGRSFSCKRFFKIPQIEA